MQDIFDRCPEEVVNAVRKYFAPALRDLLLHGMLQVGQLVPILYISWRASSGATSRTCRRRSLWLLPDATTPARRRCRYGDCVDVVERRATARVDCPLCLLRDEAWTRVQRRACAQTVAIVQS